MTLADAAPYFGKRVTVITRPPSSSSGPGHYDGVLERIDNDPQHVYLQPLIPGAPQPPYRRHGPGAHTNAIPLNEIREIRPL
ncbi:MAG TPA: hypothetical protein VFE17_10870 [Candidatus Baltobacteraceae bacterium]|jgi:hypothetical protein|nr:hypothetical protein [Candidatus Baltobacteraceae bacterium]